MSKFCSPQISGPFVHLFDPNLGRGVDNGAWYTNDHCLIRARDGSWHAFGILGARPVDAFDGERTLFHACGSSLAQSNWVEQPPALTADASRGERFLWAPHVVFAQDCYWMAYAAGVPARLTQTDPEESDHFGIFLATSPDLKSWSRHTFNPLFEDSGHARDPMLLPYGGSWLLYYTRVVRQDDRRSAVAVRHSPDLLHWSGPQIVNVQDTPADFGRDAESPFVVERAGIYYLFVCRALASYRETLVYASATPFEFFREVARLPVHAAEVVNDGAKWFITDTGWDKCGLYTAPLRWEPEGQALCV